MLIFMQHIFAASVLMTRLECLQGVDYKTRDEEITVRTHIR